MAMVKQMLKSQSFKQCRLCCFVFLSSANIFVVPFLGKCLDIVSSQMLVILVHSRGVYYNAASDMTNPRGAGTTYFHELAHMIDHASCNYRSNLSNTPEFAEALVEDGQRILSLYNNLPVEKQTAFLTRIRQDSAHSFSDLIDATTNGQLHGNYGHSRNYWTRPGNLQAEAFAHFFEASMGDQGKLELLANFFPTAFGIFSSMIDSIRPDNHVRVLSRER